MNENEIDLNETSNIINIDSSVGFGFRKLKLFKNKRKKKRLEMVDELLERNEL